jgi:hypothetical protein
LQEELRTQTYNRICEHVLSTLAGKGLPIVLMRGAALAETVYPHPALRHSHCIEFLVERRYVSEVAALLGPLGFTPRVEFAKLGSGNIVMTHESGLPVVLRCQLFQIPFYNSAVPKMYSRAWTVPILNTPVKILSPADALFQVCAEAASPVSRESYRWIDAWFIANRHRSLAWDSLLQTSQETYLTLPVSIILSYLAAELNCPIPDEVRNLFSDEAAEAPPIACELALLSARQSPEGGFKNLIRNTRNWRGRVLVLKWMLLPTRAYLAWVSQLRHLWLLPVYYVYRPLRYISSRVRLSLSSSS